MPRFSPSRALSCAVGTSPKSLAKRKKVIAKVTATRAPGRKEQHGKEHLGLNGLHFNCHCIMPEYPMRTYIHMSHVCDPGPGAGSQQLAVAVRLFSSSNVCWWVWLRSNNTLSELK